LQALVEGLVVHNSALFLFFGDGGFVGVELNLVFKQIRNAYASKHFQAGHCPFIQA